VVQGLYEQGYFDIAVFGGGIIPAEDIPLLYEKGVTKIFGPGTPLKEIKEWVLTHIKPRE